MFLNLTVKTIIRRDNASNVLRETERRRFTLIVKFFS